MGIDENIKNAIDMSKNKVRLSHESVSFYIDKELKTEYEKKVRPLDAAGINYIITCFKIPCVSTNPEDIAKLFEEALKDEIKVGEEIDVALKKAISEGFFK